MEAKSVLGNKPLDTNIDRHRVCLEDKGRCGEGGAAASTQRSRVGEQRQPPEAEHQDPAGLSSSVSSGRRGGGGRKRVRSRGDTASQSQGGGRGLHPARRHAATE